jgi:hypothetical protein
MDSCPPLLTERCGRPSRYIGGCGAAQRVGWTGAGTHLSAAGRRVTEGDEEGAFRINSAVIGRSVACFKSAAACRRRLLPTCARLTV